MPGVRSPRTVTPRFGFDSSTTEDIRSRPLLVRFVGGALAGTVLSLAFPPADVPAIGLLGIPLLLGLIHGQPLRRRAAIGFFAGAAFFSIHLYWIDRIGWYALLALVLLEAPFLAGFAAIAGVNAAGRGPLSRSLILAGIWVALEMARGAIPFGGFPWGTLGLALHGLAPARRAAAWVGTSGLSGIIVAGSSLALSLLARQLNARAGDGSSVPHQTRRIQALLTLSALVLLTGLPSALPRPKEGRPVRIAIVQAGIERPWTSPPDPLVVLEEHIGLTRQLRGENLDLILWGENVIEGGSSPDLVAEVSREIGIPISSGAVEDAPSGGWLNLVVAARPDGGEIGRYAKEHPVPFGEYVPLRPVFGRVPILAREVPRDMIRGTSPATFNYDFGPASPVISYESAFPGIVRTARLTGATMIEVHTNNSSYGRSSASEQHLALDQMRAAELGVPVLRAAITGISALIDSAGRVVASLGLYERAVLRGEVRLGGPPTPYARAGDWTLAYPLILASALLGLIHRLRDRLARDRPV